MRNFIIAAMALTFICNNSNAQDVFNVAISSPGIEVSGNGSFLVFDMVASSNNPSLLFSSATFKLKLDKSINLHKAYSLIEVSNSKDFIHGEYDVAHFAATPNTVRLDIAVKEWGNPKYRTITDTLRLFHVRLPIVGSVDAVAQNANIEFVEKAAFYVLDGKEINYDMVHSKDLKNATLTKTVIK
ncbi:MAG: hypothetical protein HC896_06260 [Bacteroidales bacterium]|nr:hypothetical protein [Bacteroidales bacterium]